MTYAASASGVSLSGSIVIRTGVKSGSVFILSVWKRTNHSSQQLKSTLYQRVLKKTCYQFHPRLRSFSPVHQGRYLDSVWIQNRSAPTGRGSLHFLRVCRCESQERMNLQGQVSLKTLFSLSQTLCNEIKIKPLSILWRNGFMVLHKLRCNKQIH